ncbi:MAG: MFS transporter [Alphaproteobacteria bacterium]|nr:MFS transporter [Alphaproteobacteria bacterium]
MLQPLTALLLWLGGIGLRITILAVPPVIPLIHDDLKMTETQVGILTGLPMVLFAGAAIAGSLLIARFGARTALIAGLLLCAAGSAARAVGPNLAMLYFGTVVTAFGVAVMQPSLPPLVRAWVPNRVGFATAVYTNGLIVGEIIPIMATIPFLLPAVGNSWRMSFVIWALPVLAIAAIIALLAPRQAPPASAAPVTGRKWLPDFRNPLLWRIGFMLGSVNSMYFSLNGFLPDYLTHTGRPDLIHGALTAMNVGQLPASFLLLLSADRMVRTVWSYLACGAVCLASVLMIVAGGNWVLIGAALFGCFGAAILVLVLALPPLLSAPEDVHRLTAGMFSISYSCAVVVPIISGALWDLTGWPVAALVPIGLCALVVVGLAPSVALRDKSAAGASHG